MDSRSTTSSLAQSRSIRLFDSFHPPFSVASFLHPRRHEGRHPRLHDSYRYSCRIRPLEPS